MERVLVDTDVIIECLRGNEFVVNELLKTKNKEGTIFFSPINKAEVFSGLRPNEKTKTVDFFRACECLPVTEEIGEKAGEYLAFFRKSHSLELADALIAATCFVHKTRLFTLNLRHYPMKDLEFHQFRV